MENNKAVSVLRELKDNPYSHVDIHEVGMDRATSWTDASISEELEEAIDKALLVLEFNDCVDFGYWLVNAPNKEIHSKKWIEQKYQQYIKEKGVGLNE